MSLTQINKAGLDEIALDHVFTIGASGSSAYTFQGEGLNGTVNNPTLYLTRGKTYRFENGSGGHPIRIQSTSGASGTAYNTGVTNNAGNGTVIVEVQHDAPDVLYYQCTSHAAMNGILYITGALADGGVTTAKIADDAVNNDKLANSVVATIAANTAKTSNATHTGDVTGSTSLTIANDAVTTAKIANNAVTTAKIADTSITAGKIASNAVYDSAIQSNAVTTAKIADQAVTLEKLPHGTSSNDGKFLRANNGADPTFETVTPPAITSLTNAASNRVITSNGGTTANAESALTYDGTTLALKSNDARITIEDNTSGTVNSAFRIIAFNGTNFIQSGTNLDNNSASTLAFSTINGATEWARFDSSGRFMIGTTTEGHPAGDELTVSNTSGHAGITIRSGTTSRGALYFSDGTSGADEYRGAVNYDHTDNYLRFYTNGLERVRILSGGGITFNGDTAAANALDDYEEGTWTPQAASGVSGYQFQNSAGYYTKIGNIVWWFVHTTTSLVPNDNQVYEIHGLPYTSAATNHNYGWNANIVYTANSNHTTIANMRPLVQRAASYIYFHTVGLGSSQRVFNSTFRNGMQGQTIIMAGNYQAA